MRIPDSDQVEDTFAGSDLTLTGAVAAADGLLSSIMRADGEIVCNWDLGLTGEAWSATLYT